MNAGVSKDFTVLTLGSHVQDVNKGAFGSYNSLLDVL